MKAVRTECDSWSIPAYPFSYEFLEWEMLDIIKEELIRNVILCLIAVLVITLLLLAHPTTAFLVFLCVLLTLIDVLGFMYVVFEREAREFQSNHFILFSREYHL